MSALHLKEMDGQALESERAVRDSVVDTDVEGVAVDPDIRQVMQHPPVGAGLSDLGEHQINSPLEIRYLGVQHRASITSTT